jgi:hypothetical protein
LTSIDLPLAADSETFTDSEIAPIDGWPTLGIATDERCARWLPEGRQAALLTNCTFVACTFHGLLTGVRFERCIFEGCRFHLDVRSSEFLECQFASGTMAWAVFSSCKMKFSRFTDNTFAGSIFLRCDLHRSTFSHPTNTFSDAIFALVSISTVSLSGTTGITRASFRPKRAERSLGPGPGAPGLDPQAARQRRDGALAKVDGHYPLIQEDEREYRLLLEQSGALTSNMYSTLERRRSEAADVWRLVSGTLTERGKYRDAAWAYVRAKRRERDDLNPLRKHYVTRDGETWQHQTLPLHSLHQLRPFGALLFADMLCGFGNFFGRVLALLVGLTAAFALALKLGHGLRMTKHVDVAGKVHSHDVVVTSFLRAWAFAFGQLVASPPKDFNPISIGWSVAAAGETLLGVALVGLFGFVVANRIRFA